LLKDIEFFIWLDGYGLSVMGYLLSVVC